MFKDKVSQYKANALMEKTAQASVELFVAGHPGEHNVEVHCLGTDRGFSRICISLGHHWW